MSSNLIRLLLAILLIANTSLAEQIVDVSVSLTPQEQQWIAQNPDIVAAANNDWPPFEYASKSGAPAGIVIDILALISQRTGLNITPKAGLWSEHLDAFKNNEIDLLPSAKYLELRETFGRYTESYLNMTDFFFVHQAYKDLSFEQLMTKRIAIPKNYASRDYIQRNFPQLKIIEVGNLYQAIDAIIEGKADLLFSNYQTVSYILYHEGIREVVPLKSMRDASKHLLHMMTPLNEPLLHSIITKGLASISDKEKVLLTQQHMGMRNPNTFGKLANNYIELTQEERQYLRNNPVITLTGDPHWLPYEGFDSNGNYVGIVPDILDIFEQRLGITIERNIGQTWQESTQLFKSGQVDIISETSGAPLVENIEYSSVYLSSPVVIVMRDSQSYVADLSAISHLRLSKIEGYGYTNQITAAYPELVFSEFNNIEQALQAVAVGQTDVLLATLAQASYHMANMGGNNLRIVGSTKFNTELALGVHPDNNILLPIFNKVLQSISTTDKQQIMQRWSKDKFVSRVDYVLVFQILFLALVIITIIVLWYQKLLREINARQEAQAHYKALLNLLPSQVMIVNMAGVIESVNSKVMSDFGRTEQDLIGSEFIALLAQPHDASHHCCFSDMTQPIEQQTVKFCFQDKPHSMMVSTQPITFNKQQALLVLAVDITERVFMERAIIEAKNAAIDANHAKSSFLANMSHEIRTPMNAIIGFTQLLFDQVRDPKMVSYIKTIRSAGNSLLLLINDILDLSKIEAGKIHLQHEVTDLHKIIEEIGNIFELEVKNKQLDFVLSIEENVPRVVMVDEARLRQILFNLVGNAVKFTQHGRITLRVSAHRHQPELADITFSVIDTGIGIAASEQSIIFENFMQPKHQNVSEYGGSGLGLAISKRLLELMNSKLELSSEVGQGSEFSFCLPDTQIITKLTKHHEERIDDNDFVMFNDLSVLVADDVEDNRQLLSELLPTYGLRVDTATNGQEAVTMSEQQAYDLIFLDIRMPTMSGYQAAKIIKQQRQDVPIIAITASVMLDEHEIIQRQEFDGYLRKPVLKKDIIKQLKLHLPFVEVERQSTPVDITPTLLILDNKTISVLQSDYLQQTKQLLRNNNIDEMSALVNAIRSYAQQQQLEELLRFSDNWQQSITCFDVIEMQQYCQQLIAAIEIPDTTTH